jgi:hypothetical protein
VARHLVLGTTADGVRDISANVTSTVIALLSLLAVGVLGYGLVRAIRVNRRTQIVVTDIVAPSGYAELAEAAMLSSVARQYVQRQIRDQRSQIVRVGKEILFPASRELEPQLDDAAVQHRIQSVASDSTDTLLKALRAMAPDTADRFLGLFSVILPPPRGVSVGMAMIRRGTAAARQLGISVDIARLDGRPLASEIFWESPHALPAASAAQPGSTERILGLLEPVTRWIAVRLVLDLMVYPRRRVTRQTREGLPQLLAGGLFLQSMRDFPHQALTFGEQARTELEQARPLLPQIPLPVTTLAGVYERIGFARQEIGEHAAASDNFRAAAGLWQDAENITRDGTEAAEAKLARLADRRLKAQLASGDPALCKVALTGLTCIPTPRALLTDRVWLYNRACLYAQASSADPSSDYQKRALRWLGLALMLYHDSSMWDYAAQRDPDLGPIRSSISLFLTSLRNLIPSDPTKCKQADAEALVVQAISHTSGQY